MNCLNCGKTIPDESEFCLHCGKVVKKNTIAPRCNGCGKGIPEDSEFCPFCGEKVISITGLEKKASERIVDRSEAADNHSSANKKRLLAIMAAIVVVIVAAISAVFFLRDFSDRPSAIERTSESVVLITCYDRFGEVRSTGSGFVLYNDSTIVTNYHVIDRAVDIKISTDSDHTFSVESILAYDVDKDIAILKTTEATGLASLSAGDSDDMKKGENVVAIGSPLGNKNTVSAGTFSGRWYNNENGLDELQFSAPISSGSSGGALFNDRGHVVGITSASFIDGQNMNLAVPVEAVENVYSSRNESLTVKDLFLKTYSGTAACYLSDENTFVEYSAIVANPQNYFGKIVTTVAYIVEDDFRFLAFESPEDVHPISLQHEVPFYVQEFSPTKFHKIEEGYSGYILVCGTVRGDLDEYERFSQSDVFFYKGPDITIKNEYFELLG